MGPRRVTFWLILSIFLLSIHGQIVFNGQSSSGGEASRILTEAKRPLSSFSKCSFSLVDSAKLICTCHRNDRILELGVRDAAFQVLKRLASQLKKLEITLCSLEIKRDFFTDLELDLDEFEVNGARELRLEHHSLKFDYLQHPIRIKFSAIGNPMSIHHDTFGVNVRSIILEKVKLYEFTTDSFIGIDPSSDILILSSSLTARFLSMQVSSTLKLRSLVIKESHLDNPGDVFMQIQAEIFELINCDVSLFVEGAIKATVDTFRVRQSNLSLAAKSLNIRGNDVIVDQVLLREPKQLALAGLEPQGEMSKLEMTNVTLRDPSRGSLVSGFGQVHFANIYVSLCLCNITRYLLSEVNTFGVRIFIPDSEVSEVIHQSLENATFCTDPEGLDTIRPNSQCSRSKPLMGETSAWILVLLLLGILAVIIFVGIFVYRWHRVLQMRYRIMKAMRVFQPEGPESKEQTMVTFNHNVQVIPRPPSVYYIDQDALDQHQPDLIRSSKISTGSVIYRDSVTLDPKGHHAKASGEGHAF